MRHAFFYLGVFWLVLCHLSSSAAENTTVIEGVTFGEMKTLVNTTSGYIYDMEIDLWHSGRILFSDYFALRMVIGTGTMSIAGADTNCRSYCGGYGEGVGTSARFNYITSFLQLNQTTIITVDRSNHCLRMVDRDTQQTSTFVGKCTKYGFLDGINATFNTPYDVIRDSESPNLLLVSDYQNQVIRQVNILTSVTSTLIAKPAGLKYPTYITYDPLGQYLVISNQYYLAEKHNQSKALINVVGSTESGFADGKVFDAKFNRPQQLVFLSENVRLLADENNDRLRVLNTTTNTLSSICSGSGTKKDGPAEVCAMSDPFSLMVHDGIIYVGQSSSIRTISYTLPKMEPMDATEKYSCPKDIAAGVGADGTTAEVKWETPYGTEISMKLSKGKHDFYYKLQDGSDCNFTVSVNAENKNVRKRLDIVAQYDIKCSMKSSLELLTVDINDLCSGGCQKSNTAQPKVDCQSDVMTVTWPTDLLLPATTEQVPESVSGKISAKINNKQYLKVLVYTQMPPISYPKLNEMGMAADLVLTDVCTDGFFYDSAMKACVSSEYYR